MDQFGCQLHVLVSKMGMKELEKLRTNLGLASGSGRPGLTAFSSLLCPFGLETEILKCVR